MNKDQRKFTQSVVANKKSRKQFWAEPLTVSQLSRTWNDTALINVTQTWVFYTADDICQEDCEQ